MKKSLIYFLGIFCLLSLTRCNKTANGNNELPVINLAEALKNPSEMTLSLLGSKITYIPLELSDSSLISGMVDGMIVTYKYITISNAWFSGDPSCMLFDRTTGKFLNTLGHKGQDPEAYSSTNSTPVFDPGNESFIFQGNSDKLLVFEPNDVFKEYIDLPFPARNVSSFVISSNDLVLREGISMNPNHQNLFKINNKGEILDSLSLSDSNKEEITTDDISNMTVLRNSVGTLPGYTFIRELKNGKFDLVFDKFRWLWNAEKEVHFFEAFKDSIYNYTNNTLQPIYAIETGYSKENLDNLDFLKKSFPLFRTFFETSNSIVFVGNYGLMSGEYFGGIYNKKTNETIAGKLVKITESSAPSAFVNDIDGFCPVMISCQTEDGNFAGLLTVDHIKSWMDENPDYKFPEEISWIKDLPEDANPLVVIVSKD